MNQREAYDHGKADGYAAASYLDDDDQGLTPEAIVEEAESWGYSDPDDLDKQEFEEVARSAAYEVYQSRRYRLYMDLPTSGNRAEGLWEKYDEGVTVGINKGVREYLDRWNGR